MGAEAPELPPIEGSTARQKATTALRMADAAMADAREKVSTPDVVLGPDTMLHASYGLAAVHGYAMRSASVDVHGCVTMYSEYEVLHNIGQMHGEGSLLV